MIKIDLITGFLGSGKTTFLIKYAKYLMDKGERICILENDYGAVNIDMMLLDSLGCDREMIAGGCDYDCHMRRFKTKLISMAMMGYTRVIVEPSGIYDTDEFFDTLCEDPLTDWYEIGNVFCIYDINTNNLSYESEYILVSEASVCGRLIISKREGEDKVDLSYINSLFKKFDCNRVIEDSDVSYTDNLLMEDIENSGYASYDHIKVPVNYNSKYDSIYIMDTDINKSDIMMLRDELFSGKYGNILRIKGFIYEDKWIKVNITENICDIADIDNGQKIVIVIGEDLNKDMILNLVRR